MNKYEVFLRYFEQLQDEYGGEIPPEVFEVLQILREQCPDKKPVITQSGMQILHYLRQLDNKMMTASEIAQGMDVSTRKVTGAIRKLTVDNFVEKFGRSPVKYKLTEKGKNFNLEEYNID